MGAYLRLWGGNAASTGVVLVDGSATTGYRRLSPGAQEGVLGNPAFEPIMASSIDQSPKKVAQRETSRTFTERIEVVGTSWTDYCTKRDALLSEVRDANESLGAGRLRVRSMQGSAAVEAEIQHIAVGPLTNHTAELLNRATFELQFTCSPYLLGDPMDATDGFDTDTLGIGGLYNTAGADWLQRVGATAPTITGGYMQQAAGAGSAVMEHVGTPYTFGDTQQTVEFVWTAQASGNGIGVVLKRLADGSHLRVVIDDNGATSTLRIQKVAAGGVTATDLGTPVALAARVPVGGGGWLRGRLEGNLVVAEHFTSKPNYLQISTTATNKYSTTLAGADAVAFGDKVEGATGLYFAATATASIRALAWNRLAFAYAGTTVNGVGGSGTPTQIATSGRVPGTGKALATANYWALVGQNTKWLGLSWMPRRSVTTYPRPFGVLDAAVATNAGYSSNLMADTADVGAFNGTVALTTNAASSYANFTLEPSASYNPDADGIALVRVIARVRLSSTVSAATIRAELSVGSTTTYPLAYGSTPRALAPFRAAASTYYRLIDLGVFAINTKNSVVNANLKVPIVDPAVGTVALDYVSLHPVSCTAARLIGATTNSLDDVIRTTSHGYRADSDLTGFACDPQGLAYARTMGLIGARMRVPTNEHLEWVCLPSDRAVDPGEGTTSGNQTHGATMLQISMQPRYWIGS